MNASSRSTRPFFSFIFNQRSSNPQADRRAVSSLAVVEQRAVCPEHNDHKWHSVYAERNGAAAQRAGLCDQWFGHTAGLGSYLHLVVGNSRSRMHHVSDHHANGGHLGTGVYAYTTTAVDGTFTLSGVPEGNSYKLVIQSGKWLNQFTEPSSGTLSGPISGLQLNMPTAHSATANIPLIAIQTGSADALECVFRDIGVATTEFTDDSVISGSSLRRAHSSL